MTENRSQFKTVAIGGGHGLSATAAALRSIEGIQVSAIVGTTDNGGSTGDIRRWSKCIAWGDLRHVLNSLSDLKPETLQSKLFEFRFEDHEGALSEQSLGNIMLHALERIADRPQHALDLVVDWLEVDARLIPMSEEVTELAAEAGQDYIEGETQVDSMATLPDRLELVPSVSATPEAVEAIENADLIILGPGSVMTSVLPTLLIPDIQRAISSSKAHKVWIQNPGHEEGPMGTLDPIHTHAWLEGILGFEYCDCVLADVELPIEGIPHRTIQSELKDADHSSLYSVKKLSNQFRELLK